jgi:hypothetical protein
MLDGKVGEHRAGRGPPPAAAAAVTRPSGSWVITVTGRIVARAASVQTGVAVRVERLTSKDGGRPLRARPS